MQSLSDSRNNEPEMKSMGAQQYIGSDGIQYTEAERPAVLGDGYAVGQKALIKQEFESKAEHPPLSKHKVNINPPDPSSQVAVVSKQPIENVGAHSAPSNPAAKQVHMGVVHQRVSLADSLLREKTNKGLKKLTDQLSHITLANALDELKAKAIQNSDLSLAGKIALIEWRLKDVKPGLMNLAIRAGKGDPSFQKAFENVLKLARLSVQLQEELDAANFNVGFSRHFGKTNEAQAQKCETLFDNVVSLKNQLKDERVPKYFDHWMNTLSSKIQALVKFGDPLKQLMKKYQEEHDKPFEYADATIIKSEFLENGKVYLQGNSKALAEIYGEILVGSNELSEVSRNKLASDLEEQRPDVMKAIIDEMNVQLKEAEGQFNGSIGKWNKSNYLKEAEQYFESINKSASAVHLGEAGKALALKWSKTVLRLRKELDLAIVTKDSVAKIKEAITKAEAAGETAKVKALQQQQRDLKPAKVLAQDYVQSFLNPGMNEEMRREELLRLAFDEPDLLPIITKQIPKEIETEQTAIKSTMNRAKSFAEEGEWEATKQTLQEVDVLMTNMKAKLTRLEMLSQDALATAASADNQKQSVMLDKLGKNFSDSYSNLAQKQEPFRGEYESIQLDLKKGKAARMILDTFVKSSELSEPDLKEEHAAFLESARAKEIDAERAMSKQVGIELRRLKRAFNAQIAQAQTHAGQSKWKEMESCLNSAKKHQFTMEKLYRLATRNVEGSFGLMAKSVASGWESSAKDMKTEYDAVNKALLDAEVAVNLKQVNPELEAAQADVKKKTSELEAAQADFAKKKSELKEAEKRAEDAQREADSKKRVEAVKREADAKERAQAAQREADLKNAG